MNPLLPACAVPPRLVAHFRGDAGMRSRNVSGTVRSAVIDVPVPPASLLADWDREIATYMLLEPGDVEPLPLARTRARWPEYSRCVAAMRAWMATLGMPGILEDSDLALMACRGAPYHHDADQYGGAAFGNLFLSDDQGLDVRFPAIGQRIALTRGTAMLFDTGQPHGVVRRGGDAFDAADFPPGRRGNQVFLSWTLPVEAADVARALGIAFDAVPELAPAIDDDRLTFDGAIAAVCPRSGEWRR